MSNNDTEKVKDSELDYDGERGVEESIGKDPAYNNNIFFYYLALSVLGFMGIWGLIAIVDISMYSLKKGNTIDIPDILVSIVSAVIGALAGLFAKR